MMIASLAYSADWLGYEVKKFRYHQPPTTYNAMPSYLTPNPLRGMPSGSGSAG